MAPSQNRNNSWGLFAFFSSSSIYLYHIIQGILLHMNSWGHTFHRSIDRFSVCSMPTRRVIASGSCCRCCYHCLRTDNALLHLSPLTDSCAYRFFFFGDSWSASLRPSSVEAMMDAWSSIECCYFRLRHISQLLIAGWFNRSLHHTTTTLYGYEICLSPTYALMAIWFLI